MKNKMAGLLMETGALHVKEKWHRKKYFANLLEELEEVPESVIDQMDVWPSRRFGRAQRSLSVC
jgi:hypothetical protein